VLYLQQLSGSVHLDEEVKKSKSCLANWFGEGVSYIVVCVCIFA